MCLNSESDVIMVIGAIVVGYFAGMVLADAIPAIKYGIRRYKSKKSQE